jgi:hypothetical protein
MNTVEEKKVTAGSPINPHGRKENKPIFTPHKHTIAAHVILQ